MDIHSATEQAYKKGYEDGKPTWIPVSERLPENADKVLALSKASFGRGYLYWLIRYNHKKCAFYDYDSEWGDIKIHNVTHWMPLPKPPNCGEKMDGDGNVNM